MEHATYEKLIAGATEAAKASKIGYGLFTMGRFQIYAFPVQQRTTIRREHYRFTHYLGVPPNGSFYRTNKATFLAALAEQPGVAPIPAEPGPRLQITTESIMGTETTTVALETLHATTAGKRPPA